jgi:hypothetical protein
MVFAGANIIFPLAPADVVAVRFGSSVLSDCLEGRFPPRAG